MKFIYAKELKKDYIAYGSFYNLHYSKDKIIKCRSVLEIYNKKKLTDLKTANTPNAIFIMMNPGNSEPKNKKDKIPVIYKKDILENKCVKNNLVLTKPDTTQYQLMRVMQIMEWNHIRVINLSDIREPKSKNFFTTIDKIRKHDSIGLHSVFSDARNKELKKHFLSSPNYVIAAWGIDDKLEPLIQLAVDKKCTNNRIGVSLDKTRLYYSHPSPYLKRDKLKWLDSMLRALNKAGGV